MLTENLELIFSSSKYRLETTLGAIEIIRGTFLTILGHRDIALFLSPPVTWHSKKYALKQFLRHTKMSLDTLADSLPLRLVIGDTVPYPHPHPGVTYYLDRPLWTGLCPVQNWSHNKVTLFVFELKTALFQFLWCYLILFSFLFWIMTLYCLFPGKSELSLPFPLPLHWEEETNRESIVK